MQFTSVRKPKINDAYSVENQNRVASPVVQLMNRRANFINPTIINEPRAIVSEPDVTTKKMKWGPPIWFFFHTLAEKVKSDQFSTIKNELINNIILICKNLPCPNCAAHATEYMSKINFNTIQTKEDLKMLLFHFHNSVNQRKQLPFFSKEEFDKKYVNANTVNIFNHFILHFQDKHKSIRMISDDIYRQRLTANLKSWLFANINRFDQ